MNTVRTVSDTKRDFYTYHTRPINSIYRRVVEELMVEMHLLSVNVDFNYDPIYGLGVVTCFDRFMQSYQPENDKESIFNALCQAVGGEAQQYQEDAQRLKTSVDSMSGQDLISWLSSPTSENGSGDLATTIAAIAQNSQFKYSRLFAIGLFSLLEQTDSELAQDQKQLEEVINNISSGLNLPSEKLQKDLELYRSNLEKMAQARVVIEDAIQADRKKREERAKEKEEKSATPSSDSTPSAPEESDSSSDSSEDEAPSS
ncbi:MULTISPECIES: photosystem II biogenesis protein Psp29 [Moorena]|uniref:Protein Thf1 n=1 Tax=Moorena producens 3L TaxID=489825 RepID=F4XJ01_9CYAN|nr:MULTISPECIES: photosystem II biogenesis protein Psp29 [Moorena]NEQ14550.1 photosystem II biogenesis protein Psp29 [Moorena sp. SIO3E2]EGJ35458.1 photosystem II biogenesis protein Psp29 [Moorena producens 3L]NEP70037.1 photosystem II biogenesis protein Psp29 [Moorena sp. SIO3A5]NEQ09226.1 photosystem II biogenesis protein Psp29 [Moorena sp. SIO4E2]NES43516.1 photosystem II biogenesis protein Psp29 [Moorena sp. SIO2C4]